MEKIMRIGELPSETTAQLCNSLESGPTINWRKLMMREFAKPGRKFYTERDAEDFEKYLHPAKELLKDLNCREVTVPILFNALEAIGNKMAMSIIQRGVKKKDGPDNQDCGSRPPLETIMREPVENATCSSQLRSREQSETLGFPIQESTAAAAAAAAAAAEIRPEDPGLHVLVKMIVSKIFPCIGI